MQLDLFKIVCNIHVWFPFDFFSIEVQVLQPYNSTDTATTWNNSHFILSERSDFHMVINQSIVVHALSKSSIYMSNYIWLAEEPSIVHDKNNILKYILLKQKTKHFLLCEWVLSYSFSSQKFLSLVSCFLDILDIPDQF